jgi:hypothetical protein
MSGAKEWNFWRSRRMLKNAYVDANISFDAAENKLSKFEK